ncbi:protein VASCULAR ASSOCIATED DEATH 1, chloroplastic-like isoform X2 [Carya illinoinensis]|nr:protein VASCULAR ASSOCIATED DEATH 1, chloroplastic-like isoform X2 [Carya illinoinensis]
MYLFVHHICFYSNIFGFETKKIIPFHEVTSVRRVKTAGIFPNAIEIVTGSKKYQLQCLNPVIIWQNFFASFLSRDKAFKIIHDGWLNHSNGAKGATEQQESASESSSQENGGVLTERVKRFESPAHESDSLDRNKDPPVLNDSPINVEDETVTTTTSEQQDNVGDAEPVLNAEPSSSEQTFILIIFFD